ncbi:hypothetical protein ACP275_14G257600 [Erythranthe tilingii]
MAKKQVPAAKANKTRKNSKTPTKFKSKGKKSATISTKRNPKHRNRITKTGNDDASSEETKVLASVPSSSAESQNDDDVLESSEADEVERIEERSSSDEDVSEERKKGKMENVKNKGKKRSRKHEDEAEEDGRSSDDENEEQKRPKIIRTKGKLEDVKNKGKRLCTKVEDDGGESEAEEKGDNALYTFPMNRVSRIIKSENPDVKISQEAVFLINKASEKFLQLFTRDAYAQAFIEKKNYTAYNHLSSVVSTRSRFGFLSDFVPEKVKAEDAIEEEIPETEK